MIKLHTPRYCLMVCVGVLFGLLLSLPKNQVTAWKTDFPSTSVIAKEPVRRALLVGINTYQTTTAQASTASAQRGKRRGAWGNLDGPVNDVEGMREVLMARFGFQEANIRLLKNEEATRENILRVIQQHLIDKAAPGDISFFFYAGHGSQVVNSKSIEDDKLDESFVPADSSQGAADIRDKELAQLWNQALDKQVVLTVMADSCHSGSIQRGGYPRGGKLRWVEKDPTDVQDPSNPPKPEDRNAVILSATRDDQLAAEQPDDNGIAHGLFSAALLKVLQTVPVNEPAERVYLRVKALMQAQGNEQEPSLAASNGKRPLFSNEADTKLGGSTTVAVLNVKSGGEVELQGGRAVGLAPECELKKSTLDKTPIRLRVLETKGLNRCLAQITQGTAKSIKAGDLFEVDRWVAREEALLRVWLPPDTLPHAEIVRTAQALASLRTSDKIEWVDDPADRPQSAAPLYVLTWGGKDWQLLLEQGKTRSLGLKPTPQTVLAALPPNETSKPALMLHLPPSKELHAALPIGVGTTNNAIQIVRTPTEAHYLLLGRWHEDKLAYAWALPKVTKEQFNSIALPARTDWHEVEKPTDTAAQLEKSLLNAGRVKAWLQLEAPPERTPFPYHLAIKNKATNEIKTSGITVEKEEYDLILQADRTQLEQGPVKPRYVYVFVLNSFGKPEIMFPRDGGEQVFPYKTAGESTAVAQTEYVLRNADFTVNDPFGIDTFVLLTSYDAIPNLETALSFEGVRTRAGLSPLEKLLSGVGAGTRSGATRVPTDWSIQRISLKSISKAESGRTRP